MITGLELPIKIICHADVTGTRRHEVTSGGLERITWRLLPDPDGFEGGSRAGLGLMGPVGALPRCSTPTDRTKTCSQPYRVVMPRVVSVSAGSGAGSDGALVLSDWLCTAQSASTASPHSGQRNGLRLALDRKKA
jgi:hypothetical protein